MKHFFIASILSVILFSCSSDQVKQNKHASNEFYKKALELRDKGQQGSAFRFFNKAKDNFLQEHDSLDAGKCLVNMAIISTDKGDYFGGQELSLNAISYFDAGNKDDLVYLKSNLNNLGIASSKLKQHSQAISFYEQSLKYTTDSSAILVIRNNIANAYRRKKDYTRSLAIYQNILKKPLSNKEFARVLSNFAITKWLQDSLYNAIPELWKALQIRKKENDLWGQNASYSHLSDYYSRINLDSALYYAKQLYMAAQQIESPDDKLDALEKLIRLCPAFEVKQYYKLHHLLDDSLQTSRNAAKNQFALIRYDSERNKVDNLRLQKDNTEKRYQIVGVILLLISSLSIALFWYRKRRARLHWEAQSAIRENRLKTSKKVHDVVANGLYRIMTEVENQGDINKEQLLDKLEVMYEQSRDISYEKPELIKKEFYEKITGLLTSFANEAIKVAIVKNNADIWKDVSSDIRYEILHILQELMVNMKKHSQAQNVAIMFEQQDKNIKISYTDDGVGLPTEIIHGNGLTNTVNRINNNQGTITFTNRIEKGTAINIVFLIT